MDDSIQTLKKMAEDGLKPIRSPLQQKGGTSNWVRGDKGWFNLNNIISIGVTEFFDSSYEARGDRLFQVEAFGVGGKHIIIKSYNDSRKAYGWLGKVIGEQNG